jgi:N-acetylmuramoyl-L-alanine amidase
MKNMKARNIDQIFIHCAATKEGRDIKTETIKSWHVKGRGWRDIGYHYVIELDGSIHAGRPLHRSGAGVKGHNDHSVHVCYVGGIDSDKKPKDTRTPEQKASLIKLIADLSDQYPAATIHGHNEFAAKACPSFDVQKEFGKKPAAKKVKKETKAKE